MTTPSLPKLESSSPFVKKLAVEISIDQLDVELRHLHKSIMINQRHAPEEESRIFDILSLSVKVTVVMKRVLIDKLEQGKKCKDYATIHIAPENTQVEQIVANFFQNYEILGTHHGEPRVLFDEVTINRKKLSLIS